MLDRRQVVAGALATLAASAHPRHTAAATKHIGMLWTSSPSQVTSSLDAAFIDGLRALNYIEGKDVTIARAYGHNDAARLRQLARQFATDTTELIVAQATLAALAMKAATSDKPIVMTQVGDPVGAGLVRTLGRPGMNVTGLTNAAAEVGAKRLELLRELMPRLTNAAALWDTSAGFIPGDPYGRNATERAARAVGVQLQTYAVAGLNDLPNAFASAAAAHAQAVIVLPSPLLGVQPSAVVGLAAKHRLPAVYQSRFFVELGGLMSYGSTGQGEVFYRAATYVDKLLRGAHPEELPVEEPSKFELVINRKTAESLGLKVPPSLLLRADQVIE
jgi:putative ABC transport system substrate-binding protein